MVGHDEEVTGVTNAEMPEQVGHDEEGSGMTSAGMPEQVGHDEKKGLVVRPAPSGIYLG